MSGGVSSGVSSASSIPTPVLKPSTARPSVFSRVSSFAGNVVKGVATNISSNPMAFIQTAGRAGAADYQARARMSQAITEQRGAEFDAQIAERDASLARFSARQEAEEVERDNKKKIKSIRSAFSKGGVASGSGSALLAQLEAAEQGQLEANKVLFEGQLKADAAMTRAAQARYRGQAALQAGRIGATTARIAAVPSILTGARNIAN